MLLTPEGKPAGRTDRIMLLAMWTRKLQEEIKQSQTGLPPIIAAGLGKPTFPVNEYAAKSAMIYWSNLWSKSQEARHLLHGNGIGIKATNDKVAKMDAVVNYGDPRGDFEARDKMAKALSRWYERVTIEANHVLFTVGGAGALHIVFETLNRKYPNSRIITPFPHYSLYIGPHGKNNLYPIPVMQAKGYQLTAELLAISLKQATELAKKDGHAVNAFLLCDPNNPLGTVIDGKELPKIAEILRRYPKLLIILDEAYAEMRLDGKRHLSLLTIAPDLKKRMVLMRSATKALSSAGERMATIITFDDSLMAEFLQENINVYGHAPRSLQYAFAEAMDKLDIIELANLNKYYQEQTNYVAQRLTGMNAALPDSNYRVTGTFYVVGNFSDLFGLELPPETQRALNKTGTIKTDEDIAYYLLFNDRIMIAPLSYFGISNRQGYMRITCSGGNEELKMLMDRLENRLLEARKIQQVRIELELAETFKELEKLNNPLYNELTIKVTNILNYQSTPQAITAASLKESNLMLKKVLSDTKLLIAKLMPKKQTEAATKIQSWWRGIIAKKDTKLRRMLADREWIAFVNQFAANSSGLKNYLLSLPLSRRLDLLPWRKRLQEMNQLEPPNFQPKSKL